jgi:hypothetical protein
MELEPETFKDWFCGLVINERRIYPNELMKHHYITSMENEYLLYRIGFQSSREDESSWVRHYIGHGAPIRMPVPKEILDKWAEQGDECWSWATQSSKKVIAQAQANYDPATLLDQVTVNIFAVPYNLEEFKERYNDMIVMRGLMQNL